MEWVNSPYVIGSHQSTRYLLTSLSIAGLQFVWSIEQAYVNIYLLDLGITKSYLSLMWIASPLCGLVVQPIIGMISDNYTSKHGRRRPLIILSAVITCLGLLIFGWAEEIALHMHWNELYLAVVSVLIMDVFVNSCQICCRALIVDMFPEDQQVVVNGWASMMAAVGHFISYYLGACDLQWLGFSSQIKAVTAVFSFCFLACISGTTVSCHERVLIKSSKFKNKRSLFNVFKIMRDVVKAAGDLDFKLTTIFKVQFFSWYGWFTFLFYGSTYASAVWMISNRAGSAGGSGSVAGTGVGTGVGTGTGAGTGAGSDVGDAGASDLAKAGSYAMSFFAASSAVFACILPSLRVDIVNVWTFSLVVYAIAVLLTGFVHSYNAVLILFVILGLPWASTLWVPFSLTAQRVHELPNEPHLNELDHVDSVIRVRNEYHDNCNDNFVDDTSSLENLPDGHIEKSGLVLGLHNAAVTLPQFVSTFGSYLVFRFLDTDPSSPFEDGGSAIAITLQIGAVAALIAAWLTRHIHRDNTNDIMLP